jgi:hypothetical protein
MNIKTKPTYRIFLYQGVRIAKLEFEPIYAVLNANEVSSEHRSLKDAKAAIESRRKKVDKQGSD